MMALAASDSAASGVARSAEPRVDEFAEEPPELSESLVREVTGAYSRAAREREKALEGSRSSEQRETQRIRARVVQQSRELGAEDGLAESPQLLVPPLEADGVEVTVGAGVVEEGMETVAEGAAVTNMPSVEENAPLDPNTEAEAVQASVNLDPLLNHDFETQDEEDPNYIPTAHPIPIEELDDEEEDYNQAEDDYEHGHQVQLDLTRLANLLGGEVVFADRTSEESEDEASVAKESGVKGWAKRNKAKCVRLVALVAVGAPEQEVPSPALLPPIPDKKYRIIIVFLLVTVIALVAVMTWLGLTGKFVQENISTTLTTAIPTMF